MTTTAHASSLTPAVVRESRTAPRHTAASSIHHRTRAALRGERGDEPTEVIAVAIEQCEVEVALRLEMAVDDRLRHPGGSGDLVKAGRVVTALAEEPACRVDDQGPPLGAGQTLSRSGAHVTHG